MIVKKETLIKKFAETMGKEKAAETIDEAVVAAGYDSQEEFTPDQAYNILDILKDSSETMIFTMASFVASNIVSSEIIGKGEYS